MVSNVERWDAREEGYLRIAFPHNDSKVPNVFEAWCWMGLPSYPCTIHVYVPRSSNVSPPNRDYPIRPSYFDICFEGCLEYGEEYGRMFLETTLNVVKTSQFTSIDSDLIDHLRRAPSPSLAPHLPQPTPLEHASAPCLAAARGDETSDASYTPACDTRYQYPGSWRRSGSASNVERIKGGGNG